MERVKWKAAESHEMPRISTLLFRSITLSFFFVYFMFDRYSVCKRIPHRILVIWFVSRNCQPNNIKTVAINEKHWHAGSPMDLEGSLLCGSLMIAFCIQITKHFYVCSTTTWRSLSYRDIWVTNDQTGLETAKDFPYGAAQSEIYRKLFIQLRVSNTNNWMENNSLWETRGRSICSIKCSIFRVFRTCALICHCSISV